MCGRYTVRTSLQVIANLFEVDAKLDFVPRYNVAPSQEVPVVCLDEEQRRHLRFMKWGLIPFWAKDSKIGYKLINARSETASEKPAFRDAYKKRRCLIVADGFYEWKKEGNSKVPYYIYLKDRTPFAFAGLFECWKSKESDNIITSCTILTTHANDFVAKLHDRMPVILPPREFSEWLNPNADASQLVQLLKPFDTSKMDAHPVSTHVNSPKNDDLRCIANRHDTMDIPRLKIRKE